MARLAGAALTGNIQYSQTSIAITPMWSSPTDVPNSNPTPMAQIDLDVGADGTSSIVFPSFGGSLSRAYQRPDGGWTTEQILGCGLPLGGLAPSQVILSDGGIAVFFSTGGDLRFHMP
jgi:hypothetical protein